MTAEQLGLFFFSLCVGGFFMSLFFWWVFSIFLRHDEKGFKVEVEVPPKGEN